MLDSSVQLKVIHRYFWLIVLLSLAIALTIRFPMVVEMLFDDGGRSRRGDGHHRDFSPDFTRFLVEFLITFIVALLMFVLNFFILRPADRQKPLGILKVLLAIGLTILFVEVLNNLLFSISNAFDTRPPGRGRRNEFDFTNFFVSVLVVGCVLVIRLVFQKQSITLENEALKREALQSQYESLKNQLSPHFLFNSLTALKVLIQDAPDKAQIYINSLSKALRYTLQSNEKRLVTLSEEMEFMESFLYLIRIRFDTNISVETKIDQNMLLHKIPPLTIQTLVENAIKHNEISRRKPLKIEIETTDLQNLVVKNNIQKKYSEEGGTGIGLTNLSKQFFMLIGKDISITRNDQHFIVEIPLINPES